MYKATPINVLRHAADPNGSVSGSLMHGIWRVLATSRPVREELVQKAPAVLASAAESCGVPERSRLAVEATDAVAGMARPPQDG